MRQETITKTYLTYDELSEEQKGKVCEKHNDINTDHEWYDCTQDDFHTILGLLGYSNIESEFQGFWSQGDGASFKASFDIPKTKKELRERLKALKEYAPDYFEDTDSDKDFLALDFKAERKDDIERLEIYKTGRYAHECTMFCDHEGLQEFSRYLAAKYYITLEKEWEYLSSREAIEETLIANEYEFDVDTLQIS